MVNPEVEKTIKVEYSCPYCHHEFILLTEVSHIETQVSLTERGEEDRVFIVRVPTACDNCGVLLTPSKLPLSQEESFDIILRKVIDNARPLLRLIPAIHPQYTSHGEDHCERILDKLNEIIPAQEKRKLSSYENFLLACAIWLHDVGMAILKSDEPSLQAMTAPDLSELTSDFRKEIRRTHNIRSFRFVSDFGLQMGLMKEERDVVAQLCLAHRKEYDLRSLRKEWRIGDADIRIQLLAALLRLADACDLDARRASLLIYEVLDVRRVAPDSVLHYEGHFSISGVKPDPRTWTIYLYANPSDQDGEDGVNMLRENLEEELASLRFVLVTPVYGEPKRDLLLPYGERVQIVRQS